MKLVKYITENDLIYKIAPDSKEKIFIQDKRYNPQTNEIIDIKPLTKFYIDENGIKHIIRLKDTWQELNCKWDDELVFDGNKWRVKTYEEKLIELKNKKINELAEITKNYIYRYYPDVKQKSDLNDKEFHTTLLITKMNYTADYIAKQVYESAARILSNQSTLQTEISRLSTDENGNIITIEWNNQTIPISWSWEQLIKVAIRQGWVQNVKLVYNNLKQQILSFNTIEEVQNFLFDDTIFPRYPEIV